VIIMTTVLIGNLFESDAQTLVNIVNCVGVMGKGIALEFKKRYPAMFQDYVKRCNAGAMQIGRPYHYTDLFGASIVNFPTRKHWRSASRVQDIEEGLDYFVAHYQEWGVESVAFPPLGCGNGGLEWSVVGPLMAEKLKGLPVPVEIYAPYGTSATQLTTAFLSKPAAVNGAMVGVLHPSMKDEWLALFEVVYQLSKQPFANPVGRTIFQKISYIMTELGVNTGFSFEQGSYGPFSRDVQTALTVAANANLIEEKQLGRMTAILPAEEYVRRRENIRNRISPFQNRIDKTVDLFSRIQNTAQAEEVTTVIFSAKHLKGLQDPATVYEQNVFDFIMDWKKSWQKEGKRRSVASAIRNLQMLGWVRLNYSESLPYEPILDAG
jgi:O-acetyl-ADP-ribose deacetylase (regulator of RNase III)/uncharacterized protein YwgA